jgi:hypothetical protein
MLGTNGGVPVTKQPDKIIEDCRDAGWFWKGFASWGVAKVVGDVLLIDMMWQRWWVVGVLLIFFMCF